MDTQVGGSVVVATAIVAIVEFLKRVNAKFPNLPQISGEGTILLCAVLGAIAGLLKVDNLNVATGIAIGLAAAGTHQIATAAGGK